MEKFSMRRAERKVEDISEINNILQQAGVIRLGLFDGKEPYIVPLNFGFELLSSKHIFYMHCANEGRKLDVIKMFPACCFELDIAHEVTSAKQACGWSMNFMSVMGTGHVEVLKSIDDKLHGLSVLMRQYDDTDKPEYDFSKLIEQTTVLKLTSETISCKVKA